MKKLIIAVAAIGLGITVALGIAGTASAVNGIAPKPNLSHNAVSRVADVNGI